MAWITSREPSRRLIAATSRNAPVASWTEVELDVVILSVDRHRVRRGVLDVPVGDAVLSRRRMDIEHES